MTYLSCPTCHDSVGMMGRGEYHWPYPRPRSVPAIEFSCGAVWESDADYSATVKELIPCPSIARRRRAAIGDLGRTIMEAAGLRPTETETNEGAI